MLLHAVSISKRGSTPQKDYSLADRARGRGMERAAYLATGGVFVTLSKTHSASSSVSLPLSQTTAILQPLLERTTPASSARNLSPTADAPP